MFCLVNVICHLYSHSCKCYINTRADQQSQWWRRQWWQVNKQCLSWLQRCKIFLIPQDYPDVSFHWMFATGLIFHSTFPLSPFYVFGSGVFREPYKCLGLSLLLLVCNKFWSLWLVDAVHKGLQWFIVNTEARLAPGSCTVQYKQLMICIKSLQFCSAWPKQNTHGQIDASLRVISSSGGKRC